MAQQPSQTVHKPLPPVTIHFVSLTCFITLSPTLTSAWHLQRYVMAHASETDKQGVDRSSVVIALHSLWILGMIYGVSQTDTSRLTIVFDAADGTLPRLHQSSLKLTNISRIFITHLHADHVLGLVSILTTIMSGIGMDEKALEKLKAQGTSKKVDYHDSPS